jgi:hypothetical protein
MVKLPQEWLSFSLARKSENTLKTTNRTESERKRIDLPASAVLQSSSISETSNLVLFNSSPGVSRLFCGKCGINLMFTKSEGEEKGLVDVHLGTLDLEFLEGMGDGGEFEGLRPSARVVMAGPVGWINEEGAWGVRGVGTGEG